jgi:hypothetical protein
LFDEINWTKPGCSRIRRFIQQRGSHDEIQEVSQIEIVGIHFFGWRDFKCFSIFESRNFHLVKPEQKSVSRVERMHLILLRNKAPENRILSCRKLLFAWQRKETE